MTTESGGTQPKAHTLRLLLPFFSLALIKISRENHP